MKRIIQISLFSIAVIGLLTLTGFIVNFNQLSNVAEVRINIYRNGETGFLNQSEILTVINSIDSLYGRQAGTNKLKINEVETGNIENVLANNPYVDMADSYLTVDGSLLINIKEKEPIIRIYDNGNKGFYIDNRGDIIPVSRRYAPRVIIANGYINEKITNHNTNIADTVYNKSIFRELYVLTQLINQNNLLKAQINQIYVNSKGEYDLIPELGDHVVQFGTIENAQNKLCNLGAFYRKTLTSNDWDNYKIINLTYKDQIVCTKK